MSNEHIQIGTKLRDAAVDPQPGDYRPVTTDRDESVENAGFQVGSKLRDAAVDPRPGDYKPYLNPGTPPAA